ncbi:hypothetical protein D3C73_494590 [compost metagenome]
MQKVYHSLRIFVGVVYAIAGINGFFLLLGWEPFLPKSPEAVSLLGTGYLLAMEKSAELLGGILLLSGRYVPLGLVFLFPLTLNIVAFHLFVDQNLLIPVLAMGVAHLYLIYVKRNNYTALLAKF